MKIALQLYTMRDHTHTARDFEDVLRRTAEIGYAGVQLSAVGCMTGDCPELDASQVKALLNRYGLACCANHQAWEILRDRTEAEILVHHKLGCDYVAIGVAPKWAYDGGPEGFRRLCMEMAPIVEELDRAGIRFGYHNHAIEFEHFAAGRPFDVLLNEAPPKTMFELDTYWVNHAGVEIVPLIEKLAGRLPVVHLKDKGVFGWEVDFAPVGEGNLDWSRILPAFKDAGTEWLIVEQDTTRRDVFDCIRSSYEFLAARN